MQVILMDKVVNLGNLGDVVKVKDGFARNFLIPTGRAQVAPRKPTWKRLPRRRPNWNAWPPKSWPMPSAAAKNWKAASVQISHKAGVDGRLFGSVTNADIADALIAQGYDVGKAEVRLPEGPFKTIGEYPVVLALHPTSPPTSRCRCSANSNLPAIPGKGRDQLPFLFVLKTYPAVHVLSTVFPLVGPRLKTRILPWPRHPLPVRKFRSPTCADARCRRIRVEAEQAVLGGLLLDNRHGTSIGDLVSKSDFYRQDHRQILRAIVRLITDNKPADVVTVAEALQSHGELEGAGGLTYLARWRATRRRPPTSAVMPKSCASAR